jgi:hypothetical protein
MPAIHVKRMLLCLTGIVSSWPGIAAAQSAGACSQAYETAQEERAAGHLTAALAQLRICVGESCPKFIREDCARWTDQTEASLPSVVFAVRRDGRDEPDVEIRCDGALVARSVDGKAMAVDPGTHDFSFRVSGFEPVQQRMIIREGERNRLIEAEFNTPIERVGLKPKPAFDDLPRERANKLAPTPYWTYGFAGLGLAGVANFGLFAVLGYDKEKDLDRSCSPNCPSSSVDSVRTKYVIADVSLGVGLVSLGVATYLYLSGRPSGTTRDNSLSFVPHPSGSGGILQYSGGF